MSFLCFHLILGDWVVLHGSAFILSRTSSLLTAFKAIGLALIYRLLMVFSVCSNRIHWPLQMSEPF